MPPAQAARAASTRHQRAMPSTLVLHSLWQPLHQDTHTQEPLPQPLQRHAESHTSHSTTHPAAHTSPTASTHMAGRRRTASDIAIVSESEANSYDSDSDSDGSDSDVDSTVNDSGGSELYDSEGDTLSTSSGGGVGGQDSPHEPVRAQTHDSHVRAH